MLGFWLDSVIGYGQGKADAEKVRKKAMQQWLVGSMSNAGSNSLGLPVSVYRVHILVYLLL